MVEHATERVHVGAAVDERRGLDLLGGEVVDRPQHGVGGRGDGGAVERLRKTEVGEIGVVVAFARGDQDVGGLDVAMDEAEAVRGVQRSGDLDHQPAGEGRGQATVDADERAEVDALHERHRDVERPVVFARVLHRDDVGVLDAGGHARFAREPRAEVRALAQLGRDDLEGGRAVERYVVGEVDDAHAAAADLRLHAVPGEHGSELGGHEGSPVDTSRRWSMLEKASTTAGSYHVPRQRLISATAESTSVAAR